MSTNYWFESKSNKGPAAAQANFFCKFFKLELVIASAFEVRDEVDDIKDEA